MPRRSPPLQRYPKILFLCSLMLCLWLGIASPLPAQRPNRDTQVQTGVTLYQAGQIKEAIAQWEQALRTDSSRNINQATILENLARATQQLGQTSQALAYWGKAIALYQHLNTLPQLGRALTEQAQAYSRLGQYAEAIAILCNASPCPVGSAIQIAQTIPDPLGEVAALGSLGDAYRLQGDYAQALIPLEKALKLAATLDNAAYRVAALNSLGHTYISKAQSRYRRADSARRAGDTQLPGNLQDAESLEAEGLDFDRQALNYFQSSMAQSEDGFSQTRALIGAIPAFYRTQDPTVSAQVQRAIALVQTLPHSVDKVYAILDLIPLLQPIQIDTPLSKSSCPAIAIPQSIRLLKVAVETAQVIQDSRSQSFALGNLGRIYECQGDLDQALSLTQAARTEADQDLRAKDSLYLWEWQLGRILRIQGQESEAISAYDRSVNTLEEIRGDLLNVNRDLQFDFRDTVDPLYRQSIELRLESASPTQNPSQPSSLVSVLKTLDSLRLAELQNYFGNDCIITPISPAQADSTPTDPNAAVFSSIILNQQAAIVVRFADGTQELAKITISSDTLRQTVDRYRKDLESYYKDFDRTAAEQLYRWIIEPFTETLQQKNITTLVFIPDGILRSVPMAALVNPSTQNYLIQDYAIAITPSLMLTDPAPFQHKNLRALTLGLTESATVDNQDFPALTSVAQETLAITDELPGSKRLLNADFTQETLTKELDRTKYSILHIATHGQFGTDAEDTFLVTGDQKKLTINGLDAILRQTTAEQIDILSLTACQTAIGDDRSALGLAGVAIQAGAKSALASLWFINDATTAQIATQFYAALLDSDISKAKALQLAQIAIIEKGGETARPGYWSPFILIGNWL